MSYDPDLYEERLSIILESSDAPPLAEAEAHALACMPFVPTSEPQETRSPQERPFALPLAQNGATAPVEGQKRGITLRPYQQAAVDACLAALAAGEHPVLDLPTGAGKSACIAALCAQLEGRILVATHRKKLLSQSAAQLTRYLGLGEGVGIYSAGLDQRDTQQRVIFGGVQSIYRRMDLLAQAGSFQYIIVDECHLVGDPGSDIMYTTVLSHDPEAQRIGLTATPSRMGMPIWGPEKWFTTRAISLPMAQLTPEYLAPLTGVYSAVDVDFSMIRKQSGEFVQSDASQVMSEESVARAALTEVCQLAQHRQAWAIFCCDIAHCDLVASMLRNMGIACGVMHSGQSAEVNDAALQAFEQGHTRALASVAMMTTGFDVPRIDCVVLLRPTMSKELLIQILGRGTRQYSSKSDTLILDYAGNLDRHEPLDELTTRTATRARQQRDQERAQRAEREKEEIERQAKHARSVAERAEEFAVTGMRYRVVPSKRQPGKSLVMVEYLTPTRLPERRVVQWLCVEYEGWPRQQAEAWFTRRAAQCPRNARAALSVAQRLFWPETVLVERAKGFDRIVMERFTIQEENG